tara:strand:- start:464 stop:835 length:372 start_codon:yes stop_codon:yes gene_type:complete
MTLTKRSTKGSALTYTEMDDNLTHLDLYKSVENVTGGGALSLTTATSIITTTGTEAYTLADGTVEGQVKIITMKVDGGDATVTPTNYINGTSILFNNVNDTIVLMYLSTGWVQLARQNATVQG